MLEVGGNVGTASPPVYHADSRLRIYMAFEDRGAVHLDLERVVWANRHAWEVVDVERHRGIQGLTLAHRSVSHDASENCPIVFPRGMDYQSLAGVQQGGIAATVPSHFWLGTATDGVARQLQYLAFCGQCGGRRYHRLTRRSQHRQGNVLPVEVNAGATDLHSALILAVVTLVGHVPDLQVVTALLQVHINLVVWRQ